MYMSYWEIKTNIMKKYVIKEARKKSVDNRLQIG